MMAKSFINYYFQKGREYAQLIEPTLEDGKNVRKIVNLGRVLDKENGIFKSLQRGTFCYSLNSGFSDVGPQTLNQVKEVLNLSFGSVWLIDEVLKKTGFLPAIESAIMPFRDTLLSLLSYKLTDHGYAFKYASEWYEYSYARILYPKADVRSHSISDFLTILGLENNWKRILDSYLAYLGENRGVFNGHALLIDSTGLPNDINFHLTAVNNHNGVISDEVRLVYAIDRFTKMPIYFRYIAGNIVDVSTLLTTLAEISAYRIDVLFLILDAGYFSESNIRTLNTAEIPFVIRLKCNNTLYKSLTQIGAESIINGNNLINYKDRALFIKKDMVDLYGRNVYAFTCVDLQRRTDEIRNLAIKVSEMRAKGNDKGKSDQEITDDMKKKGMFVIISTENVEPDEILPLYYSRQSIEQVFDIGKNCVDLLPLRTHTEETFRGHLMLSFLATAIYILIGKQFSGTNICPLGAFHLMRELKVKIFENKEFIVQEPNKKMNEIIKHLNLDIPRSILN
jgi:hypothetical protein